MHEGHGVNLAAQLFAFEADGGDVELAESRGFNDTCCTGYL